MVVLTRTLLGKPDYLRRVASIGGQPTAQSCPTLASARTFRTIREAEAFVAKHTGIGAGVERFQVIEL